MEILAKYSCSKSPLISPKSESTKTVFKQSDQLVCEDHSLCLYILKMYK